jgi:hypothetical protein
MESGQVVACDGGVFVVGSCGCLDRRMSLCTSVHWWSFSVSADWSRGDFLILSSGLAECKLAHREADRACTHSSGRKASSYPLLPRKDVFLRASRRHVAYPACVHVHYPCFLSSPKPVAPWSYLHLYPATRHRPARQHECRRPPPRTT